MRYIKWLKDRRDISSISYTFEVLTNNYLASVHVFVILWSFDNCYNYHCHGWMSRPGRSIDDVCAGAGRANSAS